MVEDRTRRNALKAVGLGAVAGLAGCMDIGKGGTSGSNSTGTDAQTKTNGSGSIGSQTETETQSPSSSKDVIDDFEDLSAWKVKNGELTASSKNPYTGSQSGVVKRTDGEPVVERPVNLDAKKANLSVAVYLEAEKHAVFELTLINENNSNSVQLAESVRSSTSGFWHRLDLGVNGVSGLPDLSNVTKLRIRMRGGGDGGKIRLDDLRKVSTPDGGYVAVMFDDAQRSDYTQAFQTLKEYDIPATSAIVTNHVGSDGFLNLDQMKEMKSAGWEFAAHSANHENLYNASRLQAEREVVKSKEWLVDHGFEAGAGSFVYPYGLYNDQLIEFVNDHYDMAFGFFSARNAANGYVTDPMTISRGDGSNIEKAKSMVDFAHLYNDLEIITFHGIDRGGKFDVTSEEFEEFAAYLDQADVTPITLSQVQAKFKGW